MGLGGGVRGQGHENQRGHGLYFPMDRTSSDKMLGILEDFGPLNAQESILY